MLVLQGRGLQEFCSSAEASIGIQQASSGGIEIGKLGSLASTRTIHIQSVADVVEPAKGSIIRQGEKI